MRVSSSNHQRESGIILVLVLWILAALSVLVSAFNGAARTNNTLAATAFSLVKADALGMAGIELSVAKMLAPTATRWVPDGRPHDVLFAGATIIVHIQDTRGLLDINRTDATLVHRVLRKIAGRQEGDRLFECIIEHRREAVGTGLWQQKRGTRRQRPYVAFRQVADLQNVCGAPSDTMRELERILTVYNARGTLSLASTPEHILRLLEAVDDANIETLIAARADGGLMREIGQRLSRGQTLSFDQSLRRGPIYKIEVSVRGIGLVEPVQFSAVVITEPDSGTPYRMLRFETAANR